MKETARDLDQGTEIDCSRGPATMIVDCEEGSSSSTEILPSLANPLSPSLATSLGNGDGRRSTSNSPRALLNVDTSNSAHNASPRLDAHRPHGEYLRRHNSSNSCSMGFLGASGEVAHKHLPLLSSPEPTMGVMPLYMGTDSNAEPLSFFLDNAQFDRDPSDFGLGSVVDGMANFSSTGRPSHTTEQLCLFRSHRLLQAEAAAVALSPLHTMTRQRLRKISGNLARQVQQTVREQTDEAVKRVAESNSASDERQQAIVDAARRNCHRLLTVLVDETTSSLKDIAGSLANGVLDPGFSLGTSSGGRGTSSTGLCRHGSGGGGGNGFGTENRQVNVRFVNILLCCFSVGLLSFRCVSALPLETCYRLNYFHPSRFDVLCMLCTRWFVLFGNSSLLLPSLQICWSML